MVLLHHTLEETNIPDSSNDSEGEYRSVRKSLLAGKGEFAVIAVLLLVYLYLRFTGIEATWMILLGIVVGIWLAFRPSEWAVEGIESISGHLGLTAYVAGMLTSLASNMPEAVISGIAAWEGYTSIRPELLDIAVLSVLIAAGFNMLLLGFTIMISTKGAEDMDVPEEAIKKDSVLIRWTIVALLSMFALGVVELASSGGANDLKFPAMASLVLFFSYLIYGTVLTSGDVVDEKEAAVPHHSKRSAGILSLIGFIGIFLAGEILTHSVDELLTTQHHIISGLGDEVTIAAFILGAAGALPEHGIALIAAAKGKIGIAIGNLIGGVLQIVLLVMGGIGVIVPIPLDHYVLFQIVVIAGSLWFLKRAITDDHRLDFFEGAMIVLLQAYVFVLLLSQ